MANRTRNHAASSRGFTLIELLVAIAVLLVVIIATARIFGTASHVVGMGQASANIMQEAAALERRMREDIAKLSHEGFFAIRQVAVPNNINVADGGGLLNPFLPDDAFVRADQLVFFTTNVDTPQTAGIATYLNAYGQGTSSRVYYGHGVQLPGGEPFTPTTGVSGTSHDPGIAGAYPNLTGNFNYLLGQPNGLVPWRMGPMNMVRTNITTVSGSPAGTNIFSRSGGGAIDGTQPDALQWLLTRQSVALVDDDVQNPDTNAKTVHLGVLRTARSIFIDQPGHGFTREIRNGRLDAAATRLDDIRRYVRNRVTNWSNPSTDVRRPWNDLGFGGGVNADQRSIIASSIYYPRVERYAPSMHRVDQALTNHVIGTSVSSFIVEWTWEDATGAVFDEHGNRIWCGIFLNEHDLTVHQPEQPWFGLNNWLPGMPESRARGVGFVGFDDRFQQPENRPYWEVANFDINLCSTLWPGVTDTLNNNLNNFERYFGPGQVPGFNPYGTGNSIRIYEALFGYNRDVSVAPNPDNGGVIEPFQNLGYTPWPTAIRVTVVYHDPAGRMEHGREFQFVIDLPRRTR